MSPASWMPLLPERSRMLSDTRLQMHHAAQLVAAMGISYLPRRADDSHTNLEWRPTIGALTSNLVPSPSTPVRLGIRPANLSILVLTDDDGTLASMTLDGQTLEETAQWIARQLSSAGLEGSRYTLERHYEIPDHPVASGGMFSTHADACEQLSRWFAVGALALEAVRAGNQDASTVRCWPHHLDIATLITVAPGRTVGAGLAPGDGYYDEPYFYVNAYPPPGAPALAGSALDGGGIWHTHEWIGAVLQGSRLNADGKRQERQLFAFLRSAIAACRTLVAN